MPINLYNVCAAHTVAFCSNEWDSQYYKLARVLLGYLVRACLCGIATGDSTAFAAPVN